MDVKLKSGTVITATHDGVCIGKMDDTTIFTDTSISGNVILDIDGNKLYFPKNHKFSGCGFKEDMFDIIKN